MFGVNNMIHFIQNIGEYFASNYFDEDFSKKVIEKSGYSSEAIREFNQQVNRLKPDYFKLKQTFVENHLRTKDKINLSHRFHTRVLNVLGYDAEQTNYDDLFPLSEKAVLPVRHILYRGEQPHLMVMEMHAMIKTKDEEEPDGLFDQSYNVTENVEDLKSTTQKYHRSQWADIFTVPEGISISPMVINKAVSELFLLPTYQRPRYILLCAGNVYFLLEAEKWFRGSYLQFDLEILFDDVSIDKNYFALFYLLLGKEQLAPTAEMVLMEQLDEDAHKVAYEVTKDLKEGVIHAVEQLANEAVHYLTREEDMTYDTINATWLKDDCLMMVYRLLFLFYAESRDELDILPTDDEIYQKGYSLEMLRDLEQVPLRNELSLNGFFFHESLTRLFRLLQKGYRENNGTSKSFRIRHLDSPLFDPDNMHYLSKVQIRNRVWQDVICELSLSKKQNGKNRGRISYANLGINQLGSVYESLLAFRGFLADTDYIEVHRQRKENERSEKVVNDDGSYLVPRHRLDDFHQKEVFHYEMADGSEVLKVIPRGTFIYRLSGRDRQKSASYYTPEVLTQTTVKYALKPILERLDKGEFAALDLLNLKILEPAMGAAAFHNEAINQIAEAYLTYRQQELRQHVDPNKYREELQKIKTHIALNNVYGVDINPTAVELGKLSLWLNVIHKDMQTPFFGYRLGVGNAVIGSWLKVYKQKEFSFEPVGNRNYIKKEWWEKAPKHLQFGKKGILRAENEIYHFLLPDKGMGSSGNIRLLKETYPAEARRMSEWRKEFIKPLRSDEYALLQKISKAIDALLLEHYEMQKNISLITEANNDFFGNPDKQKGLDFEGYSYAQKQSFADSRLKSNAPYYKLKKIMDYWCALWLWDVRDAAELPTRQEWYTDLVQILNIDLEQATTLVAEDDDAVRDYRKVRNQIEKQLTEALRKSAASLFENERAILVRRYSEQYRFFHYELEFIEVFREKNGFDLAVGNPPWIKVAFEEKGLISELFPEVEIRKTTAPQVRRMQSDFMEDETRRESYFDEQIESDVSAIFMNAVQNYPLLKGQQTNLYKCILENGLRWINPQGYLGLIHPEGVYDDPNGYPLREEIYQRLKYHFQFKNELMLFTEIDHHNIYGIHIYNGQKSKVKFLSISNLFHPSTIDASFVHNGSGVVGGYKTKNEQTGRFEWNIKPHPSRVVRIDEETLKIFARTFENSDNWQGAKLVSIHAREIIDVIQKIGKFPNTVEHTENIISECWHETEAVNKGYIQRETRYPNIDQFEMIYSGPHLFVGNPMYKSPREKCLLNSDYDIIDFSKIDENYVPRTNYVPLNVTAGYASTIKGFQQADGSYDNWLEYYKVAFRGMLSQSGERTLSGAIIPPKTAHINGVKSISFKEQEYLVEFATITSSLIIDFYIKTMGKGGLYDNTQLFTIPLGIHDRFKPALFVRTLLLNCLNKYYAPLWEGSWQDAFAEEHWSVNDERLKPFSSLTKEWSWQTPLRNYYERRMALVEIDVITAMALGLTLEELILIYNIQFPVLQQNEDDTWYDTRGNIVFTCSKGLVGVGLDRPEWEQIRDMQSGETYEHTITKSELYFGDKVTYHAPFTKCDRVEDYKRAWRFFEEKFK